MVHRDAIGAQTLTDGPPRALGVRRSARRADRHRAWERLAIDDADDRAALLIDADGHPGQTAATRGVLDFAQHRADLLLVPDVVAEGEEQDTADGAAPDGVEERSRRLWRLEAGPHQGTGAELHARRR